MKQRNLIDYTVWLQQKGFINSDIVIEALTSEYAEHLSTEAVKNNAVLPLVSDTVCPYGHKYRRHWCTDCAHFDKCKIE